MTGDLVSSIFASGKAGVDVTWDSGSAVGSEEPAGVETDAKTGDAASAPSNDRLILNMLVST